jgi:hypothetical protein
MIHCVSLQPCKSFVKADLITQNLLSDPYSLVFFSLHISQRKGKNIIFNLVHITQKILKIRKRSVNFNYISCTVLVFRCSSRSSVSEEHVMGPSMSTCPFS